MPFNDADAVRRVFEEFSGQIAGMILEPCMTNLGLTLPEPGYLAALKEICHANGAYLAFDEVKTGATVAWGGAIEAFGVTPDIASFAKAIGGGLPCGAIGGVEELMGLVVLRGDLEQVGTFNGNPLTMAAGRAATHRGAHEGRLHAVRRAPRHPSLRRAGDHRRTACRPGSRRSARRAG